MQLTVARREKLGPTALEKGNKPIQNVVYVEATRDDLDAFERKRVKYKDNWKPLGETFA